MGRRSEAGADAGPGETSPRRHCWCTRARLLLLTEMIDAAEQAQQLVNGVTVRGLEADRQTARRALVELHRPQRSRRVGCPTRSKRDFPMSPGSSQYGCETGLSTYTGLNCPQQRRSEERRV